MLSKIKELKISITPWQLIEVERVLGEKLHQSLLATFNSSNEEEAESNLKAFAEQLSKHPLKAFKLYVKLNDNQKKIIKELMG